MSLGFIAFLIAISVPFGVFGILRDSRFCDRDTFHGYCENAVT